MVETRMEGEINDIRKRSSEQEARLSAQEERFTRMEAMMASMSNAIERISNASGNRQNEDVGESSRSRRNHDDRRQPPGPDYPRQSHIPQDRPEQRDQVQHLPTRLTKMDFPKFSGEEVDQWIYSVEMFFQIDRTDDELKVDYACAHLVGDARKWFSAYLQHRLPGRAMNWTELKGLVLKEFGPSELPTMFSPRVRYYTPLSPWTKIEFPTLPMFDGTDVEGWLVSAEQCFQTNQSTDATKVEEIPNYFFDNALKWYNSYKRARPATIGLTWDRLKKDLLKEFVVTSDEFEAEVTIGMVQTTDLLASEVAGSWAYSIAPSIHGENDQIMTIESHESQTTPVSEILANKRNLERQALSKMIGIVAHDLEEEFAGAARNNKEEEIKPKETEISGQVTNGVEDVKEQILESVKATTEEDEVKTDPIIPTESSSRDIPLVTENGNESLKDELDPEHSMPWERGGGRTRVLWTMGGLDIPGMPVWELNVAAFGWGHQGDASAGLTYEIHTVIPSSKGGADIQPLQIEEMVSFEDIGELSQYIDALKEMVLGNMKEDPSALFLFTVMKNLQRLGYMVKIFAVEDGKVRSFWEKIGGHISIIPHEREHNIDWSKFQGIIADSIEVKDVTSSLMQEPFCSVPLIWTIHEDALANRLLVYNERGWEHLVSYWKNTCSRADVVVFPDYSLPMLYSALDTGNFFVIPGSPIDFWVSESYSKTHSKIHLRKEYGFSEDDMLILVIGSTFFYNELSWDYAVAMKDIGPLLIKYAKEKDSGDAFKFIFLCGNSSGGYADNLQELTTHLGIPHGSVRHYGFSDDVNGLLMMSDTVLYGSFQDEQGVPSLLLRAMSYGVPVVAPDYPTIKKYVFDGVLGLVYPKHDSEALEKAFSRLIFNGKLSKFAHSVASSGKLLARSMQAFDYIATYAKLFENTLTYPSYVRLPSQISQLKGLGWEWNFFSMEMGQRLGSNVTWDEKGPYMKTASYIYQIEEELNRQIENNSTLSETDRVNDFPTELDWYEEFYASVMATEMKSYQSEVSGYKSQILNDLRGAKTVLEIGIGTGPNPKYYAGSNKIRIYGINPMKKYAQQAANLAGLPTEIPVAILDDRVIRRNGLNVGQFLVRWNQATDEDATWEDEAVLESAFPTFLASWDIDVSSTNLVRGRTRLDGEANVTC